MEHLENPVDVFMEKTAAPLFLVQVFPWSFNNKVGLIGDAAHAIVPFYGQGMNCGFEDCAELHKLIAEHDPRRHDQQGRPDGYMIRRMAIDSGVPLFTDRQLARALVDALLARTPESLGHKALGEHGGETPFPALEIS